MLVRRSPGIRRTTVGTGAMALAGALALGACGAPGNDTAAPAPTSTRAVTVPDTAGAAPCTAGTVVPETLRFTARTVDGQPFDAATLAGKPTVLWFWAAWCPRCRAAADDVAAVHRDNAARVNVVGVAGLRSGDNQMREFVRDHGLSGFPNLADDAGDVWRRFNVTTQEYYVLLDRAGNVVHSGPLSADDLRKRVAALG